MDDCEHDRDELKAALHHACVTAKRLQQVVGNETYTTPWDRAHAYLNRLLDELVGL